MSPKDKDEYIERIVGWLMPVNPELAKKARSGLGLDGVYRKKSDRIYRLMRPVYAHSRCRGATCAWNARGQSC